MEERTLALRVKKAPAHSTSEQSEFHWVADGPPWAAWTA